LREIEEGKAHSLLAAYGLWADEGGDERVGDNCTP
jgi:hypothetical protein